MSVVHRDGGGTAWSIAVSNGAPAGDRRAGTAGRPVAPGLWFRAASGEVRYLLLYPPSLPTREQLLTMSADDRQALLDRARVLEAGDEAAAPRREIRPELRRQAGETLVATVDTPSGGVATVTSDDAPEAMLVPIDGDLPRVSRSVTRPVRLSFTALTPSAVLLLGITNARTTRDLDDLLRNALRSDPTILDEEEVATAAARRRFELQAVLNARAS